MNRSILVVEDSATQAEALRFLLEEERYAVTVARSGEEALARIADPELSLVLSDIVMPGISGYELCRRIKEQTDGRDLPVVLLTSLNDPTDIVRGLEAGADNYITKPYDPEHLLARIRRVLDSRRLRRSMRTKMGVDISFLGTTFTITSEKEQILDLLLSSVEDIVRTNQALAERQEELAEAHAQLETFARAKAQEAHASRERYRALMHHASDAIVVLDAQGLILDANARTSELLGRPVEQVLARPPEAFVAPEDTETVRCRFAEVGRGTELKNLECRFVHADGRIAFCEVSASSASHEGEALVLAIIRDVTERRMAEEALRRSEEQLRQAQRMEAIGRLTGGIAHDFNNVLTAIKGGTQLLLLDIPEDSPLREELEQIDHAANRAAALTRQLLAFSRKQVLQPKLVDLNAVVGEMKGMLRRLIGEDVELRGDLDPALGRTFTDQSQVEQVLINLVVNARDAMPFGGRVTITTRNVEPDAVAALVEGQEVTPGRYLMLAVQDTGTGMSPEVQSHIFEPFFTTKEPGKGTGLGLSTVYGIVKQTGGYIGVSTEPGHGSTFTILFPRVEHDAEDDADGIRSIKSLAGSETVLLVEDEEMVRRLARRILQSRGYTTLEARDGAEALRLVDEYRGTIDLLITDVVMPGLSGRELARELQQRRPTLRVLYMSGYTDDAIAQHGVLEPGIALVEKPFTPEGFAAMVRSVLERPGTR